MSYRYLLIIYFFLTFLGCSQIPEGYTVFQTVNEFNLEGVNKISTIKKPYIAIKKEKDTIFILIFENIHRKRMVKYVRNGDYWYSFEKFKRKYSSSCECDTTPLCIEKYIFNDTIVKYSYYIDFNSVKSNEIIKIKTHSKLLCLSSKEGFFIKRNNLSQINDLINNYKENFKPYEPSIFQTNYFKSYRIKKIGNKMYFFEDIANSINKESDIIEIIDLDNLGEFTAPW